MNANAHRLVFDRSRGMVVPVAECARAAGKAGAGARRAKRLRRAGLTLGLLMATGVGAQNLPSGGVVVRGAGTIQSDGKAMLVNQATARMVTDWTSFSIGPDASVRFVQPSADAVALNRVLGDRASTIFGSLTANGHVYLQNPSGVLFAPGAQVNVGSLVATSLQADLNQFMAGRLSLTGSGAALGEVVNEGHIAASPGGHVVLAGPRVANRGSIDAPGGTVGMAAGLAVTVDATGAGLLDIRVPVASIDASLQNSGRLVADGGTVSLQLAAADAARRTVMQVDGLVRAQRIENRGGQILLSGGGSGVVRVGGTLDASGAAGQQGGVIAVLGEQVAVVGQARLDASGDTGGGTVLVGGNFQGKGPEANAHDTFVGHAVTLDASARSAGDGGKVVVWSDAGTTFTGQITATGGARSGNGGQVEVSGKQRLNFDGDVNTRAPHGRNGTLLLDPYDLDIGFVANVNGDASTGDDLPGNNLLYADFGSSFSRITATRVANLLFGGNVSLEASNSLTVSAPLTVAPGGATSSLSLRSPSVSINAPLTLNNASLDVNTQQNFGDGIQIAADVRSLNSIALTASAIEINDALLSAHDVTLTSSLSSGASMGQSALASIVATNLTIARPAGAALTVSLDSPLNRAATLDVTADTAYITMTSLAGGPLDVRGSAGALALKTDTDVTQNIGPLTVTGVFNLASSAGDVDLSHAGNVFGGQVSFNVGGDMRLVASGGLTAAGTAGGNVALDAAGGKFVMGGDIVSLCGCGSSTIDIRGIGFDNGIGGKLLTPGGGRFVIRSSDWVSDDLGPLQFGSGATDINYVVYHGWNGADPAGGNGYYTNRNAFAAVPLSDAPPVSTVYNGLTTFSHVQTGSSGTISVENVGGPSVLESLTAYTATSTGTFLSKTAGADKGYSVADSTDVVATGSSGTNYYGLNYSGFTRVAGPWTPGAPGNPVSEVKPLAVALSGVTASSKVYDATTTATLVGTPTVAAVAGDAVTVGGTAVASFNDKNVGVAKPVNVTGYSLGGADAGNYTLSGLSGLSADITPRVLAVSGVTAANKVYDATTAATVSGTPTVAALSGDTVTLAGTASGSFIDKNVGVAKPVTLTGLTLSGPDAGNYSLGSANSVSADITPLGITVSGITAVDRVYNGLTGVNLDVSGATLQGKIAGDTLNVLGGSGNLLDKNVGVAKPVTLAGLTLGGADAGNYKTLGLVGALSADITPLAVALSGVTASSKVYDATTTATLVGTPTVAAVAGDAVTVGGTAVASFNDKNVGVAKPVNVTGYSLGGADAGNYTLSGLSGLSADITPRVLAVSGVTAANKVYDATTAATVSGTPTVAALSGDTVTLAGTASGSFIDKNVGVAKPVTLTGLTLSGPDAGNYSLGSANSVSADITPLGITVSGITAVDRVYNGLTGVNLDVSGATLQGKIAGDTLNVLGGSGNLLDKNVGVAKPVTLAGLTLGGADAGNYKTLGLVGALSADITPLAVALSGVTASSKVYDATTTATLVGTPTVAAVAGDAVTVGGTAVASFNDKNVGVAKPVNVTGYSLGGADAGNYTLSGLSGLSASITPYTLAVSGVTVASKVYDATTAATISGLPAVTALGGDKVALGGTTGASFVDKNAGVAKPVALTGLTLSGPDAANYTIGLTSSVTADITPLAVAVSGVAAANKVYDATTAATLVGTPTVVALSGDVISVGGAPLASFSDKNVGVAKAVNVVGYSLFGADAGNYKVVQPTGLKADISQAPLALFGITPANKVYDATTTATLVGSPTVKPLGNDDVAVTGTGVAAFDSKTVGDAKPVTISGFALTGQDAPNYALVLPTKLVASTTPRTIEPSGVTAIDKVADGSTVVQLNVSGAGLTGVLPGDVVSLAVTAPVGLVASPTPGVSKPVVELVGFSLTGPDAVNYSLNLKPVLGVPPAGVVAGVTVTLTPNLQQLFDKLRFNEYLQAVSDAQEPFRRAMAEALAAGFGKENIRKRLSLGLVFETGLAAPAIENIEPARSPATCTPANEGPTTALTCREPAQR